MLNNNSMRFFSVLLLNVILGAHSIFGGPVARLMMPGDAQGLASKFGSPVKGLELGLCMQWEDLDGQKTLIGYVQLKNTGTNGVFLSGSGPRYVTLDGGTMNGGRVAFINFRDLNVSLNQGFVLAPPYVIEPRMVSTVRFNLSKYLRVTAIGEYHFLVSAQIKISETMPPTDKSLETIDLLSGAVELDVPSILVSSSTNWPPSSAVAMPIEASLIDPSTARTPAEREMIQRANESTTNFFRQRWPHLLGEAPLKTNDTNVASPALVSVPIAEVEAGGNDISRWWIAGGVVATTAAVGFAVYRRARNRSRS